MKTRNPFSNLQLCCTMAYTEDYLWIVLCSPVQHEERKSKDLLFYFANLLNVVSCLQMFPKSWKGLILTEFVLSHNYYMKLLKHHWLLTSSIPCNFPLTQRWTLRDHQFLSRKAPILAENNTPQGICTNSSFDLLRFATKYPSKLNQNFVEKIDEQNLIFAKSAKWKDRTMQFYILSYI